MNPWTNNELQFARLLCELELANAFNQETIDTLCVEMDLEENDIIELLERAQIVWDEAKNDV